MGYKLPQFVSLKIPNFQSLRKVRRLGINTENGERSVDMRFAFTRLIRSEISKNRL